MSSNFECPVSTRPQQKKTWSDVLRRIFFFVACFPLLLLLALFLSFPRPCEMHVSDSFTYILRKLYFLSEACPMAWWNSILVEHFWSVNFQVWLHN